MTDRFGQRGLPLTRRQSLRYMGGGLLLPWRQEFGQVLSVIPSTKATSSEEKYPDGVRKISSRRELFVDDWLIEKTNGAELRLHHPISREIALVFDKPWEGNGSAYVTVFQDEGRF